MKVCVSMLLLLVAAPLLALSPVNKSTFGGVAIKGYDPVAYSTMSKPVEGSKQHQYKWNGATWHFASANHRALFIKNPAKYAPQYGGYCAFGVSRGYAVGVDPTAWKVVDGKLYLNYNRDVQAEWTKDIPGHIVKANANWPKIVAEE